METGQSENRHPTSQATHKSVSPSVESVQPPKFTPLGQFSLESRGIPSRRMRPSVAKVSPCRTSLC
ncbi:hypothetical protein RISK_005675 [Rhodopirellula islandica]|uniref:Uncharacterized protein n=1 Tax=Rhodopirellula islandica TaxID=595434 RepID=A0A0J1EAI2_RHOIS|nr:hypothetical protein RISK_005675 [Rhodopirellula islandica]